MSNPNLGYLFYKEYYRQIDLRQFSEANINRQKKVSKSNKKIFEQRNEDLTGAKLDGGLLKFLHRVPPGAQQKIKLKTTYPGLLLGSGYLHESGSEGEFKLGFFFDYTTGYPVIPGSSVKGKLRSVFPSFKSPAKHLLQPELEKEDELSKNKAQYIWSLLQAETSEAVFEEKEYFLIHEIEQCVFEGWDLKRVKEPTNRIHFLPLAGRTVFFDGLLDSEMNQAKAFLAEDTITPHIDPIKNPNPLKMLKVAPGICWVFYFRIPDIVLSDHRLIPGEQLEKLFTRILIDQGIGAKTNVGYGQLIEMPKPKTFQKGDEVEGIIVNQLISPQGRYEIYFEIVGNPTPAVASVSRDQYYELDEKDQCLLKVSSIRPQDKSIKYVQILKEITKRNGRRK